MCPWITVVLALVVACSKQEAAPPEPPVTLWIKEAPLAGMGERKGKARIEAGAPNAAVKTMRIEGVEVKPEQYSEAYWFTIPAAMTKPGTYQIHLEADLEPNAQSKAVRGTATATLVITPDRAEVEIRGVEEKGRPSFSCGDCEKDRTTVSIDTSFHARFELTTAAGNEIEWMGARTKSTGAPHVVTLDLAAALRELPVATIVSETDHWLRLPLKVTTLDGGEPAVRAVDAVEVARAVFSLLAKGPVDLGEPPTQDASASSALVLSDYTLSPRLLGTADKVRDVDLVALFNYRNLKTARCAYRGSNGETGTYEVTSIDAHVTVYDRRSGRKRGDKTFKAPPAHCPEVIMAGDQGGRSEPDLTAAFAYVSSFLG